MNFYLSRRFSILAPRFVRLRTPQTAFGVMDLAELLRPLDATQEAIQRLSRELSGRSSEAEGLVSGWFAYLKGEARWHDARPRLLPLAPPRARTPNLGAN